MTEPPAPDEKLSSGETRPKVDVLDTYSDLPGFVGQFETLIRRFRKTMYVLFLFGVMVLGCLCMGVSMVPGITFYRFVNEAVAGWPEIPRVAAQGCSLAGAYILYGLTLIFVVPLANFLQPFRVKPWRGPWYSNQAIPWYTHNALTYIVRYTFLKFMTPSPIATMFYRLMGMKVGRGVVINTTNISDPCLITLGDFVVIGGSATIFAHYGQKGFLVVAPVEIKKGANIGLKASIMGGVTVGENVMVPPHAALLPKTRLPDEPAQ